MWENGCDIYYDVKRTHIPPGISQRAKLRLFNFIVNMALRLGILTEKLGISHRYTIWRAVFKGIPPKKTSKLIIKDLVFDNVPNAEEYGVDPNRIAIGGDSSGGTFATAICQHLVTRKDLPKLRAQILLYPFLQGVDFSLPSYQQNHSVPVLFRKRLLKHGSVYLTGTYFNTEDIWKSAHVPEERRAKYSQWISAKHIPDKFKTRGYVPVAPAPFSTESYKKAKHIFETMFSPLLAEDDIIQQLPDTFILTCEYDVVRDDGLLYKKRLEDHGIPVTWYHVVDGFHGIVCLVDYGPLEFPGTRSSLRHVVHFLKRV
ncbi:hypothetical protein JRQ81_009855 [Phrynocephalus forsythii]|uniref:Alpha/beta hydrolase fold-3 domain-containing protein n=1 Tax=Phrynocephalus forsythii TaxID=171643 RepID=A0A9Q0XCA2_9SAUR|nr:hypothetical protein JRQ81_009855 [Phrynocephalus forsythii]